MTFQTREESLLTGEPVELYEFRKGAELYRFTSSDRQVIYQGATFVPANIKRSKIRQGASMVQSTVQITTTIDNNAAQWFVQRIPTEEATCRLYASHRIAGTDNCEDPAVVLMFARLAPPVRNRDQIILEALPYQGLLKANVLRPTFQPSCNHTIYDDFCGLDENVWKDTGTLSSISGVSASITGLPARADDYYKGGFVAVGNDKVTVLSSTGSTFVLFEPLVDASGGETAYVYPGCSGHHDVCRSVFNNIARNLSFYMVPKTDPFNGNSLRGNT